MYTILIVDDEKIERQGIEFLIGQYQFPLEVIQAENGKAAYDYILQNKVDILFTDIKMPYMDGLELTCLAKKINPDIKVVIFSAYSEFDYARKAIDLSVVHYILKPVILDEFYSVMTKVIELCEKEKSSLEETWEGYHDLVSYAKEKVLYDVINGMNVDESLMRRLDLAGLHFHNRTLYIVLFSFKQKFFEDHNQTFDLFLNSNIPWEYDYLNLNEHQGVIFIQCTKNEIDGEKIYYAVDQVRQYIHNSFNTGMFAVISNPVHHLADLSQEYGKIEDQAEYGYFWDYNMITFSKDTECNRAAGDHETEQIIDKIYHFVDEDKFFEVAKGMELLVEALNRQKNVSSVFVKFTFTEILLRLYKKSNSMDSKRVSELLDNIYRCTNFGQLCSLFRSSLNKLLLYDDMDMDEEANRLVKQIKKLVSENYMNDIGLEWISERVFLSPGYLSGFFKKRTDQSLVNYITAFRLEKAMELLQNTNMKIVDVAAKVGYVNPSYFCMVFKSHFGMSPGKFREKE